MVNPVEMWQSHQMTLKVGEDIDVDAFLNKLVNMGYRRRKCSFSYWGILTTWRYHRYLSTYRYACKNRII